MWNSTGLVSGAWCLVPGVWCLVSGVWCLVSGLFLIRYRNVLWSVSAWSAGPVPAPVLAPVPVSSCNISQLEALCTPLKDCVGFNYPGCYLKKGCDNWKAVPTGPSTFYFKPGECASVCASACASACACACACAWSVRIRHIVHVSE